MAVGDEEKLKEYGLLESAHLFAEGSVFHDVAYDFLKSPEAREKSIENIPEIDEPNMKSDIDEAKDMGDELKDIAETCGNKEETIDGAVACMAEKGVPEYVSVGIGATVARHASSELKSASKLEFPP